MAQQDMVLKAEAEAQREAMASTSIPDAKEPPTKPPQSYDGHPIEHAKRHAKGRTPPVR
jgi:hypothetical protein